MIQTCTVNHNALIKCKPMMENFILKHIRFVEEKCDTCIVRNGVELLMASLSGMGPEKKRHSVPITRPH